MRSWCVYRLARRIRAWVDPTVPRRRCSSKMRTLDVSLAVLRGIAGGLHTSEKPLADAAPAEAYSPRDQRKPERRPDRSLAGKGARYNSASYCAPGNEKQFG